MVPNCSDLICFQCVWKNEYVCIHGGADIQSVCHVYGELLFLLLLLLLRGLSCGFAEEDTGMREKEGGGRIRLRRMK